MLLAAYGAVWTIYHVTFPPTSDSKSIEIGTFSPESYYRYEILYCYITVVQDSPFICDSHVYCLYFQR